MIPSICLIAAAVSTDFEDPDELANRQVREAARTPKVGVLALASMLERAGALPCVFDLDCAYETYREEGRYPDLLAFPNWVAPRIVASGARIFGFSSVCSSYPLTVRIAERVKLEAPGCIVLFGGPQASAVDRQTLAAFPFVDFILRGEADFTLPMFLEQCWGERRFFEVPGLTWRNAFGPQRNPDAPVIEDLDELPLPAYHLAGNLKGAEYAFLELGRGCPFSCTFCSTNDFFRRKFRVKSPQRMLADMRAIAARYGLRTFELVHDMFTVDRRKVVAFCNSMIESGEGFEWSCSARTDCVDDELLALMARAGCNGIFFGVEAGSRRMQRIIDKDLDPLQARSVVETAERLGMPTTVSLIAGFPEENEDDLRETLDVYVHSLRQPLSHPQLNILAPLAGTPISLQYKDRMVLEELGSHLSYQGRSHNAADRELIRQHPDIFPNFYLLPASTMDRASLLELREFLLMASVRLRWLTVALHRRRGSILEIFRAWREHRLGIHPEVTTRDLRCYYTLENSRYEFVRFVRSRISEFGDTAVEAMLACHEALAEAIAQEPVRPRGRLSGRLHSDAIAVRAPGIQIIQLDWDIQKAIDFLKLGHEPMNCRKRKHYRTGERSEGINGLIEITPLVYQALAACNGRRTVRDAVSVLAGNFDCPEELRRYGAEQLLKRIHSKGYIEAYRTGARKRAQSPLSGKSAVLARSLPRRSR